MITSKNLIANVYEVSGTLLGKKLFNNNSDFITKQIKKDLNNIQNVSSINLKLFIDEYNEGDSVLFQIEMLVKFNTKHKLNDSLSIIENYLNTKYVIPFST